MHFPLNRNNHRSGQLLIDRLRFYGSTHCLAIVGGPHHMHVGYTETNDVVSSLSIAQLSRRRAITQLTALRNTLVCVMTYRVIVKKKQVLSLLSFQNQVL